MTSRKHWYTCASRGPESDSQYLHSSCRMHVVLLHTRRQNNHTHKLKLIDKWGKKRNTRNMENQGNKTPAFTGQEIKREIWRGKEKESGRELKGR